MTTASYHFGVEIEITAKPHQIRETPLNQLLYWEKLGKALEKRGINVEVDKPNARYRKNKERYTRGWWITRDGSLARHLDEIAFEAVSPILNTGNEWEHQIDMFWKAYSKVFHQPRSQSESYCGGHIHVSSSSQKWSTEQLRNIASGIFHFEHFIDNMIPASRQNNEFCEKNSAKSRFLKSCRGRPRKFFDRISNASRGEIWELMQGDRKVLWNFAHVVKGGTGSIEFRGGRCFRGPQRTKAWVAFAVGYMHLLQGMPFWEYQVHRREVYSTEVLYEKIKQSASNLYMNEYLPPRYTQLNESESWNRWEASDEEVTLDAEYTGRVTLLLSRFLQFAFGIAVSCVYGIDRSRSLNSESPRGIEWLFAMVVAIMSTSTVGVYGCLGVLTDEFHQHRGFFWDWLLFILWAAVFGRFSVISLHESTSGNHRSMKAVVWVDLVNMLLWCLTAALCSIRAYDSQRHTLSRPGKHGLADIEALRRR